MAQVQGQYAGVSQLFGTDITSAPWMSEADRQRVTAYIKYDQIYWNEQEAFRLLRRGTEQQPIYVPNPRTIVDSTSHYLLKGLKIVPPAALKQDLTKFMRREKFMSRFMTAKHSGVCRGDWVFHITADPAAPEGKRISLTAVHPGSYFPRTDDDDLDKVIRVYLAEQFKDGDGKDALRRLTYWYGNQDMEYSPDEEQRVWVKEEVFHLDKVWNDVNPPLKRVVQVPRPLPDTIQQIPVYHFKNMDWQGDEFGSSELRGYERLFSSVNQTITDEELALALEGLGVYATDAGKPEDEDGNEVDWEIGPGRVAEVPLGSYFKRVEGVGSVSPMLEHAKYLDDKLMESSGTFLAGSVDVQVAQSGIALAIRFLPTAAKLEERDNNAVDVLGQMWYDWSSWWAEFEDGEPEQEFDIVLGDKLPVDRDKVITELNNMFDRKVISAKFYREKMEEFGYEFPPDIDQQILDEQMEKFKMAQQQAEAAGLGPVGPDGKPLNNGDPHNPNAPSTLQPGNKSNNAGKVNESNGTEPGQTTSRQAGRASTGKAGR